MILWMGTGEGGGANLLRKELNDVNKEKKRKVNICGLKKELVFLFYRGWVAWVGRAGLQKNSIIFFVEHFLKT